MTTPQVISGMNLHVAGYGRQSYGRVNGSGAGPATQRDAGQARFDTFAAEAARQDRDATWRGQYEDVGISAFSRTERPDFERLLRDCSMGRIDVCSYARVNVCLYAREGAPRYGRILAPPSNQWPTVHPGP